MNTNPKQAQGTQPVTVKVQLTPEEHRLLRMKAASLVKPVGELAKQLLLSGLEESNRE